MSLTEYCYQNKKKILQNFPVNTVGFKAPAISANRKTIFTGFIREDTGGLKAGTLSIAGYTFGDFNAKAIIYAFPCFNVLRANIDCEVLYFQKL